MKPVIIGLMGFGGAGKSTVADRLVAAHGFERYHLLTPGKQMLRALLREFGYDAATIERYVEGDLKRAVIPELTVTSTEAQQHIGTELGRNLWNERVWLDHWLRWAQGRRAVVQESVRSADEAEAIRERGGVLVEVRRPGVGPLSGHSSESLPAAPDQVLVNAGNLAELAGMVDSLVRAL
jgi:cytidylate kinase